MNNENGDIALLEVLGVGVSARDADKLVDFLTHADLHLNIERAATKEEYVSLLIRKNYAVILSDFGVSDPNSFEALRLAKAFRPEIPFICLAESVGEETAVDLMRQGAFDYVSKTGLGRLPSAIQRATNYTPEKQPLLSDEEWSYENRDQYRTLVASLPDGLFVDVNGRIVFANPACCRLLGVDGPSQLIGKKSSEIVHPGFHETKGKRWNLAFAGKPAPFLPEKYVRIDGTVVDVEEAVSAIDWQGSRALQVTLRNVDERKNSNASLRENKARLTEAMEIARLGTWEYDVDRDQLTFGKEFFAPVHVTAAQDGAYRMTLDHYVVTFVHPDDRAQFHAEMQKALETADPNYRAHLDQRIVYPDGEITYTSVHIRVLKDALGRTERIHGVNQDITERKLVEIELRRSEELLKSSLRVANMGIFDHDHVNNTIFWSPRQREIHGWGPDELVTIDRFFKQVHPDDAERIIESVRRAHDPAGDGLWDVEHRIIRPDGTIRWLASRSQTYFEGDGGARHPVRTIGAALDITERKEAEERLRLSHEIIRRVSSLILIVDPSGSVTYASPSFKTVLGYEPADLLGDGWWSIAQDENRDPQETDALAERIAHGEIPADDLPYETGVKSKDGEIHWILWQTTKGANGELIAVGQDITERKRAEDELRKSEERYRLIAENTADTIGVFDLDLRLLYVSPSIAKLRGFTAGETESQSLDQIITPESIRTVEAALAEQMELESDRSSDPSRSVTLELAEYCKDGSIVPVELVASFLRDAGGRPTSILTVTRDLTERKRAEAKLIESEEKYRNIFDFAPLGIYQSSIDGRFITANRQLARILGYDSTAELLALDMARDVYCDQGQRAALIAQYDSHGQASELEVCWKKKNGEQVWIRLNSLAIKGPSGDTLYYDGFIRDVTAEKLAEERLKQNEAKRSELERELIQAQKLESLGTLASGIAHDFNNLLGVIMGNASLLESLRPQAMSAYQLNIDSILNASKRGAALVEQMLTFARKAEVTMQSVVLNDIVNEVVQLVRETFPKTITVDVDLEEDIPAIDADPTQVHQVLLNLCVNARDAMPNGGMLSVTTGLEGGDELRGRHPKASADTYVILAVADTGLGMDAETQRRVFEPFFTTKEYGKGTGLGLSLAFGIMEGHDGFITVRSEPGEGTTFRCHFPLSNTAGRLAQDEDTRSAALLGGHETILVVEDEDLLRSLLTRILVSKGYAVLAAADGEEGLATYREHRSEIAAVISDIGLPKFSGEELYHRLKAVNPSLLMILSSGYIEPAAKTRFLEEGVKDFIQKPYSPNQVLLCLQRVLQRDVEPGEAS